MEQSSGKEISFDAIYELFLTKLEEYDNTLQQIDKTFVYGTSGFRYDESGLEKVGFRIGIMTCLLSQTFNGLPFGIMITASHNKYSDNGYKIVGHDGETISQNIELLIEEIVNSKSLRCDLKSMIHKLAELGYAKDKYFFRDEVPIIIYGHDTRRSSPGLAKIISECLNLFPKCTSKFYGVVTTPCLYFLVNLNQLIFKNLSHQMCFAEIKDYWNFLSNSNNAFNLFYDKFLSASVKKLGNAQCKYEKDLLIDCSYGIGAFIKDNIQEIMQNYVNIQFINDDYTKTECLNKDCGAEHLHKTKSYPANHPKFGAKNVLKNISFDGDVDRIIYFISNGNNTGEDDHTGLQMIDGDHLLILFSQMLRYLISKLSKSLQNKFINDIKIGVLCTAYSNGAFMQYVTDILQFQLVIGKTGVKYLHACAKKFDIAIYFESNGHGMIYHNDTVASKIEKLNCLIESSTDSQILELIQIYLSMFNMTTGDALSAMIASECALKVMNMSVLDLYSFYNELESVNIKVQIKDKSIFKSAEDETRLISPSDTQEFIDEICRKYSEVKCRCFVRPSGTEDVVRIYAEAMTSEHANEIAETVKKHIIENYNN